MPYSVTIGGVVYGNLPLTNEGPPTVPWGSTVDQVIIALAAAVANNQAFMVQKAVSTSPVSISSGNTYLVNSAINAITLNLPQPAINTWMIITDTGRNAATNNITLHRFGSESIDGVASDKNITYNGASILLISDGTNWFSVTGQAHHTTHEAFGSDQIVNGMCFSALQLTSLGSVGAPALSFPTGGNTGIYSTGAGNFDISSLGVQTAAISLPGATFFGAGSPLLQVMPNGFCSSVLMSGWNGMSSTFFDAYAGSASAPSFSFSPDIKTGAYLIGISNYGISVGGSRGINVGPTGLNFAGALIPNSLQGATGTVLMSQGINTSPIWSSMLPRSYLAGLQMTTNAVSSLTIATGEAKDANLIGDLILSNSLTKSIASNWVVGNNQGGLDTGSVTTSQTYHVWLIGNGSVVDALFSLSATSPTMPAGYGMMRRIGSVKTDGSSHILQFVQDGDKFEWATPTNDINASNPGTSAVTATLNVPTGINVMAMIQATQQQGNPTAGFYYFLVSDLATVDVNPASGSIWTNEIYASTGVNNSASSWLLCRTNASGQVRYRVGTSSPNTTIIITTFGWIDTRGRDA